MLVSRSSQIFLILFVFVLGKIQTLRMPARFFPKLKLKPLRLRDNVENEEIEKAWIDKETEDIVIQMKTPSPSESISLFDTLYNIDDHDGSSATISYLTLREISECYAFSLSYLGDLVMQMGCDAPVDVDVKVGDFLTGQQVFTMLQALNSLDPYNTNAEYDTMDLIELSRDLDITVEKAIQLCEQESIHLPFGVKTVLHISVIEQLRRVVELDAQLVPTRSSTIDLSRNLPIQDV